MNNILIIGAGISGLAVSYFLQQNGFTCHILERDNNIITKRQGFSLTFQNKTCDILKKYNLLNEIYKHGSEVVSQKFYKNDGELLYLNDKQNTKRFNYPLPRQRIREMFFERLESETVHWNKHVVHIETIKIDVNGNQNCTNIVLCKDGTAYEADIIIACDGIHSTINKFINSKIILNDLKLMNIYGIVDLTKLSDESKEFFVNNEVQVLDGFHRFFSKPYSPTHQMWELTYPLTPTDNQSNLIYFNLDNNIDPRLNALTESQRVVESWNLAPLKEFLKISDFNDIIVHPLYDHVPELIDVTNLASRHIVLMGDSIHPMSPYIGMGANQAIMDANKFTDLISSSLKLADINNNSKNNSENIIEKVILDFYKEMIPRTSQSVVRSRENTLFYHSSKSIDKKELYDFKGW